MAKGSAVDLYWLPLGAGGHFVKLNGRAYEAVKARRRPGLVGKVTALTGDVTALTETVVGLTDDVLGLVDDVAQLTDTVTGVLDLTCLLRRICPSGA